jgi:2-polyprenyl-6-hydroxyphenyl methylase/3-demethylubiquinone-9 3-methyltransferase
MSLNTLDKDEIIQFSKLANHWWDEEGSMSFLHAMSEIRTKFIKIELIEHFNILEKNKLFKGLNILDLGCGGGIASEPLCRLGANLTGVDESKKLIEVAKLHAKNMKLKINYQCTSIENLNKFKNKYDVIIALELLEHVNNLKQFCKLMTNLLTENGIIILSTINKTFLSKLFVIDMAEKILKKIPMGTHHYEKFIKPSEIKVIFHNYNFHIRSIKGINLNPISNNWKLTDNKSVNYIVSFTKR